MFIEDDFISFGVSFNFDEILALVVIPPEEPVLEDYFRRYLNDVVEQDPVVAISAASGTTPLESYFRKYLQDV